MPNPTVRDRLPLMFSTILLAALAGCGGGLGAESPTTDPSSTTEGSPETPDRTAAAAPARGPAIAAPTRRGLQPVVAPPTNGSAVGSWRAINANANLAVAGVIEKAGGAQASFQAASSRVYYIDSTVGNDQYSGMAAKAQSGGVGPWRSLGRLLQASLSPGDTIQLACGSSWRETLRLPRDGTAAAPIRVLAASTCSAQPVIDGGVPLAPAAWRLHQGSIYKATLEAAPLQLTNGGGVFTEAHHPNRSVVRGALSSPYFKTAGNANLATLAGRTGSTNLPVGTDLVVPKGVDLAGGARIRVRSESYVIDEAAVTSFNGKTLALSRPTSALVRDGSGYLLLGQLWMLDSAGEWYHERSTNTLYAWMTDSTAPSSELYATVLPIAVDLADRRHVVVEGLSIRRTGLGFDLRRSAGVVLRNNVIEDIADIGIDASASLQVNVEGNTLNRIGTEAITGQGDPIIYAKDLVVRNNVIRDSGVIVRGEDVVSLPRRSVGAIVGASGTVIADNTVINAGYSGILTADNSQVENNFVFGACSVLDDCGAIYTGGAKNNSKIRGNTLLRTRGMPFGLPSDTPNTSAQGIYVDDLGSGVLIEGNTVVDADYGIQLHNTQGVVAKGNMLYANRRGQIWMQEDSKVKYAGGDQWGNTISGNVLSPAAADSVAILMTSSFDDTAKFATFDSNRYFDRYASTVAQVSAGGASRTYTGSQWVATEPGAWASSLRQESSFAVAGGNLIPLAPATASTTGGWYAWNATAPAGRLSAEVCSIGTCVRYVAGGSPGVVSSPGFTIKKDGWYRLSMDISSEQDNQTVPLVVRLGGADYAWLSDRNLSVTASRSWKRYSQVFQATRTIDPTQVGNGPFKARLDLDGIEAGKSVSIANVELVPVNLVANAHSSVSLVNAGTTATSVSCPFAATQSAVCGRLYTLSDDKPVNWPVQLAARSALLLYGRD